jgi:hypothetical protein
MTTTEHPRAHQSKDSTTETTRVRGEALADRVKTLVHEGNVRRITIRNDEGHTVIEIPVTAGVVAAVVAPMLVGVAAIAALANSWEIQIDRAPVRTPGPGQAGTSTVQVSAK